MFPANRLPVQVTVEYTKQGGERVIKVFDTAGAARKFYTEQQANGNEPTVVQTKAYYDRKHPPREQGLDYSSDSGEDTNTTEIETPNQESDEMSKNIPQVSKNFTQANIDMMCPNCDATGKIGDEECYYCEGTGTPSIPLDVVVAANAAVAEEPVAKKRGRPKKEVSEVDGKASKAKGSKPTGKGKKEQTEKTKREPKEKGPGEFGVERSKDLPWNDKKVAVFKALKQLRAYDANSSRTAQEVVDKSGGDLTGRDVRHYSYHAKAAGLIEVAVREEGGRSYGFYLTRKGQEVDPAKALKEQQKAKETK